MHREITHLFLFLHPTSFNGIGIPIEAIPAYIIVHENDGYVVKIGFKDIISTSIHVDNPPNGKFYMVANMKEIPFVAEIGPEESIKIVKELHNAMKSRLTISFYSYLRLWVWKGGGEIENDVELVDRNIPKIDSGVLVEPFVPKEHIPYLLVSEKVGITHLLTFFRNGKVVASVLTATDAIVVMSNDVEYIIPSMIGVPPEINTVSPRLETYEDVVDHVMSEHSDLIPLGALPLPLPKINVVEVEELKKQIKRLLPNNLNMFI